jgi:hypothetical protein
MFAVVGALLVAKRPANLIGWTMSAIALIVGILHASETYAAYVMTTRSRPDALAVAGVWVNCWYWLLLFALTFAYLPLLFPDGRLPSHRWLPVAVLQGIGSLGVVVLGALAETLRGQGFDYRIDNPIGIAIVRYRLYDIDLVIDRPLVYGSLTAVLAATYFGGPHQNMVAADHKRNGSRKTRGSVTF